jgi:hypothetical protein
LEDGFPYLDRICAVAFVAEQLADQQPQLLTEVATLKPLRLSVTGAGTSSQVYRTRAHPPRLGVQIEGGGVPKEKQGGGRFHLRCLPSGMP